MSTIIYEDYVFTTFPSPTPEWCKEHYNEILVEPKEDWKHELTNDVMANEHTFKKGHITDWIDDPVERKRIGKILSDAKKAWWVEWHKHNTNKPPRVRPKTGYNKEARSKNMAELNKGKTRSENFAAKKVIIDNITYDCVLDAADALGVCRQTIRNRIKAGKYSYG
jgi:hypothetical protein